MDMKKIQSIAGNVVTPVDFTTVKVDFGQGIVDGFASTYTSAMNGKLALRGSSISFDSKEMQSYLNLLLQLRVNSVSGKGANDPRTRNLLVPALYALSLTHIGETYDKDLGIQLIPVIEQIDSMSLDDAVTFSRKLQIVEDLGFELVTGLPRDRNGDTNFMYFHMSESTVKRHNKDAHPGYAVLAAFFRMKQLEDVLKFRVNYGLITEYEEMLKGLIYDEAR